MSVYVISIYLFMYSLFIVVPFCFKNSLSDWNQILLNDYCTHNNEGVWIAVKLTDSKFIQNAKKKINNNKTDINFWDITTSYS